MEKIVFSICCIVSLVVAVPMPGTFDGEINHVEQEFRSMDFQGSSEVNTYMLYTRRNPEVLQTLVMNDRESITGSFFDGRVPTVVVVHGWLSTQETDMNPTIRDAYLEREDVNVIIVDWSMLALRDYNTAMNGIPAAGRELGEFVAFLNRVAAAQFEKVHLVGFGLGAHLVGNAGRHLGGRVARVTGLDPAGPEWLSNPNRLSPNDAIYVEAIHTNGGYAGFGIGSSIASADFFPNGGTSQPGCSTHRCSHNRAWELFASSVTNNHLVGRKCTTNIQFLFNKCSGEQLAMGNDVLDKSGNGSYRLETLRAYPF